jgi:hypothetical protein
MPDDDIILSVRQVAGFTPVDSTGSIDTVLMQRGGLGGAYVSIDANLFARTALEEGGPLGVGIPAPADAAPGEIFCGHFNTLLRGGSGYNAYTVALTDWYYLTDGPAAALTFGPDAGWVWNVAPVGSAGDLAPMARMMGLDFEGNLSIAGAMTLGVDPQGPMDATSAQWVESAIAALRSSTVWSFNGRRGDILLSLSDVEGAGGAALWSPRFQGEPRAPTPDWCDSSSRIATTAWVQRNTVNALGCLMRDHPFVFTFNGRTGDVTLTAQDIADAGDVFNDTQFTGTPTAPTAPAGTDTNQLATTAFVMGAIAGSTAWAPLNSPTFTGNPTAPTAAPGTSTGQLATTAYVQAAITDATAGVASFNTRTGAVTLTSADITGAGGALLASPSFTGVPLAPTAVSGAANQQIATTAFVAAALAAATGVASFNTRTGAVTLTAADVTGAGGAPLASPAFTGNPTAPTQAPGDDDTSIATTAFVMAAIAGMVTSFNGRGGTVTLNVNDISAAGGLVNPSPALTGVPTAPTATIGTNTNQLATCAFVIGELATGGGVDSFNGRAGAVTLTSADLTNAGGALLASPAFTGTPTAPTAAPATATQQLATTAFVRTGVTDGSNAAAGAVGEYLSVVNASLSPGSATAYNIGSLSLSPGDWDLEGWTSAAPGAGGAITNIQVWVSMVSATNPGQGRNQGGQFALNLPSASGTVGTGSYRVNISATTTVYLSGQVVYTGAAPSVSGFMRARRFR